MPRSGRAAFLKPLRGTELFDLVRYSIGAITWFFICGYAFWRGEWPERWTAAIQLVGFIITPIAVSRPLTDNADMNVLVVDLIALAGFGWVALRSDRWWPLFGTAFHAVVVCVHIVKMSRPDTSQYVYVTTLIAYGYLTIAALAAGLIALERRRWRAARPA